MAVPPHARRRDLSPARRREVEQVVASALELPPGHQEQYLDQACTGSPELRAEAEALLQFRAPAERFLERPILEEPALSLEGHKAGPCRLVRLIGKGGMSAVYLGERDDRLFDKRVAVKIISGIRHGIEAERRFRSERQIPALPREGRGRESSRISARGASGGQRAGFGESRRPGHACGPGDSLAAGRRCRGQIGPAGRRLCGIRPRRA